MSDPTPHEPGSQQPDSGDPLAVTPERMREIARAMIEVLAEASPARAPFQERSELRETPQALERAATQ